MPNWTKGRLAASMLLALLVLAPALLVVWREPLFGLFRDRAGLEAIVAGLGPAGPLAVILLQVAQVLVSPVPGQFVGIAGGYLFGPCLGTLYSMIGLLLGTLLAVLIVRRWGRPLVERLVAPARLGRIDRLTTRLGAPVLFLVFLLPFLPDDTILLVAGLTDMAVPDIMLAAALGRLPGVLVSAWLGASATELPPTTWMAIVGAALAVGGPILYWRSALERLAWSVLERVAPRRARGAHGGEPERDDP